MLTETRIQPAGAVAIAYSKGRDYAQFCKLRLTSLVVFSAVAGYFLGAEHIIWKELFLLISGGILVTGASNGFNQIIERDLDKLMTRTSGRPLPAGRMSVKEGTVLAAVMGLSGIFILWYFLNPLSGVLGALALFMYTAIYTPMKRMSPWAVMVGAFPGAIPPMLGWVAASGTFGLEPGLLFAVQFMWQFPHFWAIAWKLDDDYAKAGFRLLPSPGGKDKSSAFQILVYSLFLIPMSLTPYLFGISGYVSAGIALLCGIIFFIQAVKLFKTCDMKDATRLMFGSFIYLPVVLIAYMMDKM